MNPVFNSFKKNIRKYVPKEVRIIRESLYINLMGAFGKRTNLLGMKEFPITLYGKNSFFTYPFKSINDINGKVNNYFAQFYGESIATDYTIAKRGWLEYAAEVLPGVFIDKPMNIDIKDKSVLPISIVNRNFDGNEGVVRIVSKNKQYDLK